MLSTRPIFYGLFQDDDIDYSLQRTRLRKHNCFALISVKAVFVIFTLGHGGRLISLRGEGGGGAKLSDVDLLASAASHKSSWGFGGEGRGAISPPGKFCLFVTSESTWHEFWRHDGFVHAYDIFGLTKNLPLKISRSIQVSQILGLLKAFESTKGYSYH